MDYLATITHQKLVMSRNPIVVIVDPAVLPPDASRVDLRYYLELHVQKSFQSNQFVPLPLQEASEKPVPTNSTSSPGAYFEVQTRIDDELAATPPVYGDKAISVCPDLCRQFYYITQRWDGNTLLNTETTTTMWAIRAQMAMRHYSMYKDVFFTQFIGAGRRFLTWQPDAKYVRTDQPERLYFLTNFTPSPKALMLRVRVCFADNSYDTFTAMTVNDVTPMSVYCMPVGFDELNLGTQPKVVLWYETWLSNENAEVVSEVRTFRVDRIAYESVRYIVFQNSLGGYDTLRCVGSATELVTVQRQIIERFTDYDYLPTVSDVLINSVTGERQITVNVGNWLNADYREYLEELLLSEDFYIVDGEEFIPLAPNFSQLLTESVSEWPIERTLSFSYANPIGGYSRLPKIVPLARATSWKQYSVSCELDASGLRTGKQIVNELVKFYTDSGENVRPLITKPNIAGTEGYIAPWITESCAANTTPYMNTEITGSSLLKRANCAPGQIGTSWTMIVPTGTYGSELSLADAMSKAKVGLESLDTQANADYHGICNIATNVRIGLLNNCPFTGGSYQPIPTLFINEVNVVPNHGDTGVIRYADNTIPAGTNTFDVGVVYPGSPFANFRITVPSKNLESPVLNGNSTYRFANIKTNWGDADLIFITVPA